MYICGTCGAEFDGFLSVLQLAIHHTSHEEGGLMDDVTHLKRDGEIVYILGDDIEWLIENWQRKGYVVEHIVDYE